jgi:hypothetical protein
MAYTTAEAREGLLDTVAHAADQIALALAYLGEVYEQLDDHSAERLEDQLFRPVQMAYGRLKRTHSEFASNHGLAAGSFGSPSAGAVSYDAKALIERAVAAAALAGQSIAELQDSMLPVEVGDTQLRSGLAEVRQMLEPVSVRAREIVRTLGR